MVDSAIFVPVPQPPSHSSYLQFVPAFPPLTVISAFEPLQIEKDGVIVVGSVGGVFTVTVIEFDVTVVGLAQEELEVITHVTIALFIGLL